MPIVPTYGPTKVQPIDLPGVRLTAAQTPLSEGAGVDQAEEQRGDELSNLALAGSGLLDQELAKIKDQADTAALYDASNQLHEQLYDKMYDPQNGWLSQKGKDAMGSPEEAQGWIADTASSIADNTLTTTRQKQMFNRVVSQVQDDTSLTLHRHVLEQTQAYASGEASAAVNNHTQAAIANALDPAKVGIERDNAVAAATSQAAAEGLGSEATQELVGKVKDGIYTGVIDTLLNTNRPDAAQAYFDQASQAGELSGAAIEKIQAALKEGTLRQQSQQQSDQIIAGGGSLSDQLDKARQIQNADLRDAVTQRLEANANIQAAAKRQLLEQNLTTAYNTVDQTHNVNAIPANLWTTLTGPDRSALLDYQDKLIKGIPVQTNWQTFYGLMDSAGDDPDGFAGTNLLKYKGQLSNDDFQKLADLQMNMRKGDLEKTNAILAGPQSDAQMVANELTMYGLDPEATPKTDAAQAEANAQLRRMFDQQLQVAQAKAGPSGVVSAKDKQAILDGIMATPVKTPGSWWGLVPNFGFNAITMRNPDGSPVTLASGNMKRAIDTTYADIPTKEIPAITQALKNRNLPVTPQSILNLYIDNLARLQALKGGGQ